MPFFERQVWPRRADKVSFDLGVWRGGRENQRFFPVCTQARNKRKRADERESGVDVRDALCSDGKVISKSKRLYVGSTRERGKQRIKSKDEKEGGERATLLYTAPNV